MCARCGSTVPSRVGRIIELEARLSHAETVSVGERSGLANQQSLEEGSIRAAEISEDEAIVFLQHER